METLSGISVLPYYLFFWDSIRRPHREGGSCVCCARSVSGSLYQFRESNHKTRPPRGESPERYRLSSIVLILSPFGCIYQTIREGRVTGWRETLSGGDSLLSIRSPLYGGGDPLGFRRI